jgi:hypothetical protein
MKKSFEALDRSSTVMYRSVCGVDEFFSETAIRIRRTDGKFNEMAEWHRQIITYRTAQKLQGVTRRSAVIEESKTPITMTPIECAVYDTNEKTIELMRCACAIWRNLRFDMKVEGVSVSSLARLLQGVVIAAVNGGTQVFIELFLRGPLKDDPGVRPFAEDLKNALRDQMKAIKFGLDVHAAVMKDPHDRAMHETWESNFDEAKVKTVDVLQKIDFSERAVFGEIPPIDFLPSGPLLNKAS